MPLPEHIRSIIKAEAEQADDPSAAAIAGDLAKRLEDGESLENASDAIKPTICCHAHLSFLVRLQNRIANAEAPPRGQ